MSNHVTHAATEAFVAYRNLLFTVAYEMLGSAADAEDFLQQTWLRWVKVDLRQVFFFPRARSVISAAETGMRYADENMLCGPCVPNSTP
jgi:hypothetical protein